MLEKLPPLKGPFIGLGMAGMLRTYLRQPNPDGALAAIGSAVIDDAWSPDDEVQVMVSPA
jgi:hypothetical protein